MKIATRNNNWFPSILEDILTENRLDVSNYENFSTPKVNIKENLATFVVQIVAPGFSKENFSIELEEKTLKVSAQTPEINEKETDEQKDSYTRREFKLTSFERSFTITDTIEVENLSAAYENGILEITLPKKEEVKAVKKMVEIS